MSLVSVMASDSLLVRSAPSIVLIVLFPFQLLRLARSRPAARPGSLRQWKLVTAATLSLLQIALLVLELRSGHGFSVLAAINVVAAILLAVLSWMDDTRSVQPSSLLSVYLIVSIALDAAALPWLRRTDAPAMMFGASTAVKLILLLLESQSKTSRLYHGHNLSPESTSGLLNRSFLWWMKDLFRRGFGKTLTLDDLFPLDHHLESAALSVSIHEAWAQRREPERRFEFAFAVWRAFRWRLLPAAVARLLLTAFNFAQPFLIAHVLGLLTQSDHDNARRDNGYALIVAAVIIYLGKALSTLYYNHGVYRIMTMFRGACVCLIYNHMLTLPLADCNESSVVTLMSTDVDDLVPCLTSLAEVWAHAIEVAIGVVLLSSQLGWVCIVPIIVVFVSSVGTAEIARTIGTRQKIWVDAIQRRIHVTASMLSQMRSVKMMGLAGVLSTIVQDQRVQETRLMSGARWSIVWQNVVQNLPWTLAPALTFVIYVAQAAAQGQPAIDVTQAFTSLSVITLLTDPAAKLLSAIPSTTSSTGSLDRIQDFLTTRPRSDPRIVPPTTRGATYAIHARNLSPRPSPTADPIATDVSFSLAAGSLTMLIGPVGSGKSTLLKAVLGEVPAATNDGSSLVVASRRIAYCAQTPWLTHTSIRRSISGPPETLDEGWYQQCLHACALDHDLKRLSDGDETLVAGTGSLLSGGQKARVALARAVYSRADIMLLDDVLSALDTTTQATIMARLFGSTGLLRKLNTTVMLATHATAHLHYAERTFLVADKRLQEIDGQDTLASTIRAEFCNQVDDESPSAVSARQDEIESSHVIEITSQRNEILESSKNVSDTAVYSYWLRSAGWPRMALFVMFVVVDVFCSSFSSVWLKWWAEAQGGRVALYMSVYVCLAVLTSLGTFGYVWSMLILISPHTARKLHAVLLKVVMRQVSYPAPTTFFSTTDSGSVLNRFSQDMTILESQLPIGVLIAVTNLFSSIASAALVITGSTLMLVSIPPLVVTIWALQHIYLRTSRQLRLLDLESKSPLFTHFLETSSGLATIRAFGWQAAFRSTHQRLLDLSQRPHYLLYCSQRWLNLVLDLIAGAQAVLVVSLAVELSGYTDSGRLGVSLNSILSFSAHLSSLVSGWTMLETSLGAVSRLKTFETSVQPEDGDGVIEPPQDWPVRGAIEFRNVTALHGPNAMGICNVSLCIKPGQKVGICGRTGSGKSSLVATILRLLEIQSGQVIMDGIDIATLRRDTLRQRLITIPQDGLLLTDLRLSIDPEGCFTDEAIVKAMERVGLKVPLGGVDLSSGQSQQLALARALLKKQNCGSTVLLVDEATSNMDSESDDVLQRVLREDFGGCTRLVVAHRVNTILDADVVIVMEGGKVVEMGKPSEVFGQGRRFAELTGG